MFKTWLKKYSLLLLICVTFSVLLVSRIPPKECVLCTEPPHHAPCLLNLSTGELGELTVYDPHPADGKMISEDQMTGTFSFLHCAGLTGYRDTSCNLCHFDIPVEADKYNPARFCSDCRSLLASYKEHTYVLVDTFDEDSLLILPINDSVTYEMRCYRILTVCNSECYRYELTVQGILNS